MTPEKVPSPLVLVVDDEPLIRWSLSEELADFGYRVCMAANAADARVALTTCDPTMILLDLRLPDAQDLGLLKEIRRTRPDVPVVVMSAYASAEDAAEAKQLGAMAFLDKPFDLRSLVRSMSAGLFGRMSAVAH